MLPWSRRRAAAGHRNTKKINHIIEMEELAIPQHFLCPISLDLMKDPVILVTGITYDRESIDKWIEDGNLTCPVTNQVLSSFDQIPNHFIRKMIQDWCVQNQSYGVQRIPTPRIPVTGYQVSDVLRRISAATQRGDYKRCRDLVNKINIWSRESQRNKKCIAQNGAGLVLSTAFERFTESSMETNTDLLEEILSALTWLFPIGVEAELKLGSDTCLRFMLWILQNGSLSAIQNAVLVLKQLVSLDQSYVNKLAKTEGAVEALIELVKNPICPSATKASLMVIFYMISPSEISNKMATTFVEMGLIPMVIEILVDGDKSISEKALGVLDQICDSKQGREKAYENALLVPVLFQKISGSNLASEYSVSIIWKLSKDENNGGLIMGEALELKVDAFQKLLILLQVSCGDSTKEKAKELLKLLNFYRAKFDCLGSSMDFRYL